MQDIRASLLAAGVHVGVRLEADLAVFALFPRAFVRPPVALDAGLPSTRDPNATSLYVREMQAAVSRREISLVDYAGLAFV